MHKILSPDTFYDDVRNMVHFYDPTLPWKYHIQKSVRDVTLDELNIILEQDEEAFNYLLKEVRKCNKPKQDDVFHFTHKQRMLYNHRQMLKALEYELIEQYIESRVDWVKRDTDRTIYDFMKYHDWMRRYRYNQWCLITGRFSAVKVALLKKRAYNKRSKQLNRKRYDTSTKRRKLSLLSRNGTPIKVKPARRRNEVPTSHELRRRRKRCRFTKKCYRARNRGNQSRAGKRVSSACKDCS